MKLVLATGLAIAVVFAGSASAEAKTVKVKAVKVQHHKVRHGHETSTRDGRVGFRSCVVGLDGRICFM